MRAHQGALRAFLTRLTRNRAAADDLAQIVFIKAFENRHKLRDPATVKSWLFQIAYRAFIDDYRKHSRRRDLAPVEDPNDAPGSDPGLAADIEAAMNSLPNDCRAVVILCLSQGMTHSEAASITGLPLGTVKSHVTRGKAKLRAFLFAYETTR